MKKYTLMNHKVPYIDVPMNTYLRAYSRSTYPLGRPWHEWVRLWWEWCYSGSIEDSPAADESGKSCSKSQIHDRVWFLAGTFGGKAERTCSIPHGRSIFFPVLNDLISFATDQKLKTEEELASYARADLNSTTTLWVRIDGLPLVDLEKYRVSSPLFDITLPPKERGLSPIKTQAVSDGFWIFLAPFDRGQPHDRIFRQKTRL